MSGLRAIAVVCLCACSCAAPEPVRFATFNVSLYRAEAGELARDLEDGTHAAARALAEIVQRVRPDVLLLNEIDFDAARDAQRLFETRYLAVGQGGQPPISYPFTFSAPVNTGVPSGRDLDHDGRTGGPGDALGFGRYPGQYGMLVLSKLPIRAGEVRTFRTFPWRDMPGALVPPGWYDAGDLEVLPLSSKSHWDVPVELPDGRVVHVLASHPTPPVFDGPEDRNGRRNHDELRFWADYVVPERAGWVRDDAGRAGGLARGASFVIAGDLNSDPCDGDATASVGQLLAHPRIRAEPVPRSLGAVEAAARQGAANAAHAGDPAADTGDFPDDDPGNLRLDYVLPSADLEVAGCGVFWPPASDPASRLVDASDHRLVWIDVRVR